MICKIKWYHINWLFQVLVMGSSTGASQEKSWTLRIIGYSLKAHDIEVLQGYLSFMLVYFTFYSSVTSRKLMVWQATWVAQEQLELVCWAVFCMCAKCTSLSLLPHSTLRFFKWRPDENSQPHIKSTLWLGSYEQILCALVSAEDCTSS